MIEVAYDDSGNERNGAPDLSVTRRTQAQLVFMMVLFDQHMVFV